MKCLRIIQIALCILGVTMITSCTPNLSDFIDKQSSPARGFAILEGYKRSAKGSPVPSFTLITKEGMSIEHKLCLIDPSDYSTSRYKGCKFVCWYNADNPRKSRIYPCLDSIVFDHPLAYQCKGKINRLKGNRISLSFAIVS